MFNLFKIWLVTFIIGLVFYPITSTIFKKFKDKGWFFSKVIGLSISSWTMWILANLKIAPYNHLSSYLIIVFFTIVNGLIIFIKWKKKKIEFNKKDFFELLKNILISEMIFIICMCTWFYIKGFSSSVNNSTEQFMDYGYLNSIMNSTYMPPQDIWLSGTSINYYYFGQYIFGFLCKTAGLSASEGYFLIIALIATYTFVLPFSIGLNLFRIIVENHNNRKNNKQKQKNQNNNHKEFIILKVLPWIVAICIGLSASIGGSLHYPIYRWFDSDKANYSYIDETRYIGYKPEVEDKTATEVPAYSSIVGDLHAHYIDLVFSLTVVALLAAYFIQEKDEENKILTHITLILIAFMYGICKMTNYWEYPIYLVIISAIIITKKIIYDNFSKKNILSFILSLLLVIAIEELITLPFTLNLAINGTKVCFTGIMSPLYKLLVKWGLPTLCVFTFLVMYLINFKNKSIKFKEYLNNNLEDLFIIIIGICAFGLVVLPEIVYLKDIYGDDYKRFNTMFKLTYQAFILFAITTNYILFKLSFSKNKYIRLVFIILLIINLTTIGYGIDAIITNAKYSKYQKISANSTESYIKNELYDDYKAIEWIRNNIDKNKIIVESTKLGNSYSTSSRISTFTGNPTVLGWVYHEWIWRSNKDYSIPEELITRNAEIKNLYESNNQETAKQIIDKYNIDYIYIGKLEYDTYTKINVELLKQLGDTVYQDFNTYLIKVK